MELLKPLDLGSQPKIWFIFVSTMSTFIRKLRLRLNDPFDDSFEWTENGKRFTIDFDKFNELSGIAVSIGSLKRQLNKYGFYKHTTSSYGNNWFCRDAPDSDTRIEPVNNSSFVSDPQPITEDARWPGPDDVYSYSYQALPENERPKRTYSARQSGFEGGNCFQRKRFRKLNIKTYDQVAADPVAHYPHPRDCFSCVWVDN